MVERENSTAEGGCATPPPLWQRVLEPVAVLILACAIVCSVAVIAWRRHHLGKDIRVVQALDASFRVNVNRAGKQELMLLPGIGDARAERILAAREKGAFVSLEEVRLAGGMTVKQFQPVRELITLGEPAASPELNGK